MRIIATVEAQATLELIQPLLDALGIPAETCGMLVVTPHTWAAATVVLDEAGALLVDDAGELQVETVRGPGPQAATGTGEDQ